MEVILLERIARLGALGDTVRVRDGFARNYLLPTGRALRANEANRTKFEAQKSSLIARNDERRTEAQGVADQLEGLRLVIVRSAGETGQLYGSVSARDIADILKEQGYQVNRNSVELNVPIKAIGIHTVKLVLHAEVQVSIEVNVARSQDEAERQSKGEKLNSADAIYGANEDAVVPGGGEFFEEGAEDEDDRR